MNRREGDLIALALQREFDVIVHGCNCFHTMDAGVAKFIARAFPEALAADRATKHGSRAKLGTVSVAQTVRDGHEITTVNAYTQHHWHGTGRLVDYDALSACFELIALRFSTARIGYPMIGAGLAGGDWDEIAPLIDTALIGLDHTLVVLPS
ncbi:macro domain-containing protein [Ruegeria sp. HKCCD8929]|uniref:macro domain-containing protein n=1 Tax=Ruegeria sp. HKCCD8929 TaxID=2683006 RepID=UPI001487B37E|nr:macro domain-containing protein [Ruegeria sp. HKCCD8929]